MIVETTVWLYLRSLFFRRIVKYRLLDHATLTS